MPVTSTSFPSTTVATNFTQLGVTYTGGGNVSISSFNGARSAPYYCSMQSSGGHPTFTVNALGGGEWAFWVKGVSGNANVTVKVDGSTTPVYTEGGTTYANGTFPFYSFAYLNYWFNIPSGVHTVTFEGTGIWAMDDATLTLTELSVSVVNNNLRMLLGVG